MGLLSGQTTTLIEGDCYNYLMNQFCEDVYFEILKHHPNRDLMGVNPVNMYTFGHIIASDMSYYMQRIFDKSPEGFQDYLIQNDYIKVEQITITAPEINCAYYDPVVSKYAYDKYVGDSYFTSKQYIIPEIAYNTELYFTWKLRDLFWQYDEVSHINDVIITEKTY